MISPPRSESSKVSRRPTLPPLFRLLERRLFDDDSSDSWTTGVKAKVENKNEYNMYLDELKAYREELGVPLKEEMYPEEGT